MSQNRNKLIELFVSNLSNAIVHSILEKAVREEILAEGYRKELINSFDIAKKYREKINPSDKALPEKDSEEIKRKVIARVKGEILTRISKGYSNLDVSVVEGFVSNALKEVSVI